MRLPELVPGDRRLPRAGRAAGEVVVTMRYSPEQWRAIATTDRHLLVAAGAGTGKTHTVVGKLLWLLGVPVEGKRNPAPLRLRDLAAITYTNQAAADLETKLREALRAANRRDLASEVSAARVGTIHAFCGNVLREFALRGGAPAAARVLEEGESAALLGDCARDALLEALEVGQIAGLERLLGDYPAAKVEQWIARLAGDADRLARITAGYARMEDERTRALVRLADDARQRLAERLDDVGGVDFDRMIVAVRDLVRDDEGVRRALRRRVRVLVIDEFQDVDPVQHEIAYLLGGVKEDAPDATRLVLVGDPKQSIYRFRRADVSIWNQVERDFGERGLGEVVVLGDNFRSAAPILAFVEHCVGPALGEPVDGERGRQDFEVDFAPVRMSRTSEVPEWAAVELLVVPPTDEGKSRRLDEARAMEAESVARRMRELHDTHRVRWGDMAVLLGGWGSLDVYVGALRRHDIPTYALRGEGYWEAREIVDCQLALRVARDPRDDQALLGFLRSPFVGVRDDTLLTIARRCAQPYWDHLPACPLPSEAERSRLERGIALATRLTALRDRISAARLLEELFADSGWLAHLALQGDDGLQPLANVRRLLDDLRRRPEASVGELLREIAEARARGDRVEPARLYGESDDVVTVSSVHSAKGLEWRAVFWCDLMRAPRGDSERLLVGRDALVLGDPDLEAKEQPTEWCALRRGLELEAAA
ncbi:MAG TPA: ATP-dependent helicase, partial [Gemmatimonadaceae bacterium]|nr:ATP-dependent helicase [Gemmatimonadaceae bacterium]